MNEELASKTLYELIQVAPTSDERQIREALTQQLAWWSQHASTAPTEETRGAALGHVEKLRAAGELLLDPRRRAAYDRARLPAAPDPLDTRLCPYCSEPIQAAARKCRWCGEWLGPEEDEPRGDASPAALAALPLAAKILGLVVVLGLAIAAGAWAVRPLRSIHTLPPVSEPATKPALGRATASDRPGAETRGEATPGSAGSPMAAAGADTSVRGSHPELPHGLEFSIVRAADPAAVSCKPGDTLSVHYLRSLPDGTKVDSADAGKGPLEFTLGRGQVIKGLDLGLVGMKVGEVRALEIPAELGYGDRGSASGGIPPGSALSYQVELLAIK